MALNSTVGVVCVHAPNKQRDRHHRKFGSRPLLEVIVRRLTDCERLTSVVVVSGPRYENNEIAGLVPADVPLLQVERADPLGQLLAAAEATGSVGLVKLDADHPFVDPVLIDRLVTTAESQPACDFVGFCFRDGRPVVRSRLGTFAEWFSADALLRCERATKANQGRRDVTRYLCSRPERFQLRFIPVPPALESANVRLSVDNHEAWEHAQTMYDWLGHEGFDWDRIAEVMSA